MRNMSFSLTTPQILDRSKTVTRRMGWKFLKPGDRIRAVKKAMGLKKGEKVHQLAVLEVIDVRRQPLNVLRDGSAWASAEIEREGFGRALQHAPEEVAYHADSPVNETDLHARHRWLVESAAERIANVKADPDFYDAKCAGWWVWGQCLWIGSGWCQSRSDGAILEGRANGAAKARGVQAAQRRWQGGGKGGGSGVVAPRLSQQMPSIAGDSGADGHGIHATAFERKTGGLYSYLNDLAARLRRVRVCCGDWSRVLTPSVTTYMGLTGVLLDPPYSHDLRERCYSQDHDISADVRAWAIKHGDDPLFRIALCGYEDEHAASMPSSWEKVAWKAHGGYARSERGKANRGNERIWFSPHCLRPSDRLNFDAEPEESVVPA